MIIYKDIVEGSELLKEDFIKSSSPYLQAVGKQNLEKLRDHYKLELALEFEENFSKTLNSENSFEKEFLINYFANKASSYIVDLATSDWSTDEKAILSERALTAMSYGLTSKLRKNPNSDNKSEIVDLIYSMKQPVLAFNAALYDMCQD